MKSNFCTLGFCVVCTTIKIYQNKDIQSKCEKYIKPNSVLCYYFEKLTQNI